MAQPLDRVDDLQDVLRLVHLEPQVRRHEVGEPARVVDGLEDGQRVGRHDAAELEDALGLLLDRAHHGLDLHGDLLELGLLDLDGVDAEEPLLVLDETLDARLGHALDQDLHPAVGQLEHPDDHGHGAHGVDLVLGGLLDGGVLLGGQEDVPVLVQRLVNRLDGQTPAHEQRQDHIRVYDHVPDGKKRYVLRYLYCLLLVLHACVSYAISIRLTFFASPSTLAILTLRMPSTNLASILARSNRSGMSSSLVNFPKPRSMRM